MGRSLKITGVGRAGRFCQSLSLAPMHVNCKYIVSIDFQGIALDCLMICFSLPHTV